MINELSKPVKVMLAFDASEAVTEVSDFIKGLQKQLKEKEISENDNEAVNAEADKYFSDNLDKMESMAEKCKSTKLYTFELKEGEEEPKVCRLIKENVNKMVDTRSARMLTTYGNMISKFNATDDMLNQAMAICYFFPVFVEYVKEKE